VPPRLVGSVANWSGKDSPDGRSWLIDQAQSLGFNTIWFSPFFETSRRPTIDADGKAATHSLYATRHYGVLDPEFSATKMTGSRDDYSAKELAEIDRKDREHLDYFMALAKKQGMRVMAMADLVFNHVAADHPLVLQEEADIKGILDRDKEAGEVQPITKKVRGADGKDEDRVIGMRYVDHSGVGASVEKEYYFKFCHNEKFETLNIGMTTGFDTAQINYESPEAKAFFITGKDNQPGYWKQVIDWCMDRGVKDFRCDIAYRLPPDWWSELITHARQRDPDTSFMAETLGGSAASEQRMSEIQVVDKNGNQRPGFDLGMISNYWWNFTDDWLPQQELPRLKSMAKYGGAASPDNHDTPETLAGHFQKALKDQERHDQMVADICARNYAISALIGNAVYMQMGYEYCNEKQCGVFAGVATPGDWQQLQQRARDGSPLDISARVKAVNDLKESLHVDNCRVDIKEHKEMQDGKLIKMTCEYIDADTGLKTADVVLVINKKPESGAVAVTDGGLLSLENGGLVRDGAQGGSAPVVRDVLIYHTPVLPSADTAPKVAYAKPRELVPA
jgi:glycosidase